MGQMTIRRLDDAKLLRLKAKAKEQGTSVEALARDAIHREAATLSVAEKLALVDRMQAIVERAKVPGVKQTPAEVLIRESRDFDH